VNSLYAWPVAMVHSKHLVSSAPLSSREVARPTRKPQAPPERIEKMVKHYDGRQSPRDIDGQTEGSR
jgi:hypothetical protein